MSGAGDAGVPALGRSDQELSEALRDAFSTDDLAQLLHYALDKRIEDITLAPSYRARVFDVIRAARREGWLGDLIGAACEARTADTELARIRDELIAAAAQPDAAQVPVEPRGDGPGNQAGGSALGNDVAGPAKAGTAHTAAAPVLRVTIVAALADNGMVSSRVSTGDGVRCEREGPLPREVTQVWDALKLPGSFASERLDEAGRLLASALFDPETQHSLAVRLCQLPPGEWAEIVLVADGKALSLPIELIRLSGASADPGVSAETLPLGLLSNVSLLRQTRLSGAADSPAAQVGARPGDDRPAPTPGPLKILAAVAAPDETKTSSAPLDTEAEMGAMLDAVSGIAGDPRAQVRILEVASLTAISEALEADAYHVLHLAAHGSPNAVELEDEDGAPVTVTPDKLMAALKHAGQQVPLIVASSCSGGATGSAAMAAGLVSQGADRVIAMLAPVTDPYATTLARSLYHELAARPASTVGQALARARYETDAAIRADQARQRTAQSDPAADAGQQGQAGHLHSDRSARNIPAPEYGVATLLASRGDGPLVDPRASRVPLTAATTPPAGKGVRELPLGSLIGRRPQLRMAMKVLRRSPRERYGSASGIVLTGIGGIGKTALAGRIISRLRDDRWLIAVHEGRWNPTALIGATTQALMASLDRAGSQAVSPQLIQVKQLLAAENVDDGPKLDVIKHLLASHQLLVVFDDFEQNLTTGGDAFLDSSTDTMITGLAEAAETGALLVTCRYPLPGPKRLLTQVPVPPLSAAELRRMFLRMPALRDLSPDSRRLLVRTIGGHPRLIEFTDALLRGGNEGEFRHVQRKLHALADRVGIDLTDGPTLDAAVNQAMILGSADILLEELCTLLTPAQTAALHQIAVCYGPMTLDDLHFALSPAAEGSDTGEISDAGSANSSASDLTELRTDVNRLTGLTLLTPGPEIEMHPWTANLVTRAASGDQAELHQRALTMRSRRFEQRRGTYDDLIDIPRHLAALSRYGEVEGVASQVPHLRLGTLVTCAYLTETLSLIPQTERAWGTVGKLLAEAFIQAGDLPSALQQFESVHRQAEALADGDPHDIERQFDLSVSHIDLGDLAAATGDLGTARTHYQASLAIDELFAATAADTGWQRHLAISHDKIGDLATAAGDLQTARTAYTTSLAIRQRLTTDDPANTQWQRDLSISHNKIGDIARASGDLQAGRAHYQAGLDIAQRLTTDDPANTQWQRDLSISHEKIGNVAAATGDLEAARTAYQASLDIRQRLAADDPANTHWQRDLSVIHNKIGDIAKASGDIAGARGAYQASSDIIARLAALDPSNAQWRDDVEYTRRKLRELDGAKKRRFWRSRASGA